MAGITISILNYFKQQFVYCVEMTVLRCVVMLCRVVLCVYGHASCYKLQAAHGLLCWYKQRLTHRASRRMCVRCMRMRRFAATTPMCLLHSVFLLHIYDEAFMCCAHSTPMLWHFLSTTTMTITCAHSHHSLQSLLSTYLYTIHIYTTKTLWVGRE